jgi:hypothetical protein
MPPLTWSASILWLSIALDALVKKEINIFLISKKIQMGAVAKSYIMKGFLIYEEMRKYLAIY